MRLREWRNKYLVAIHAHCGIARASLWACDQPDSDSVDAMDSWLTVLATFLNPTCVILYLYFTDPRSHNQILKLSCAWQGSVLVVLFLGTLGLWYLNYTTHRDKQQISNWLRVGSILAGLIGTLVLSYLFSIDPYPDNPELFYFWLGSTLTLLFGTLGLWLWRFEP